MGARPTTHALALAVVAGLLYAAAQPPVGWSLLAFVALVPLLRAVRDVGPGRALVSGWVAGTIACNGLTSASIHAALLRARHPVWLAAMGAAVVPQLCGALYFAAFAAYAAAIAPRASRWRVVVLPAAWVTGELARSRIGHGMPWVLLGHAEAEHPGLLQIADLTGAYGVSFVVALVNVALATPPRRRSATVAAGVLLATVAYGEVRLARPAAGPSIDVALVQGDVPDAWRTSLAQLPATIARYRTLVARAATTQPALVVLPENAVSVSVGPNPQILAQLAAPLDGTDALLLVGGPREVALDGAHATVRNAAYLVDAAGAVRGVYEKRHLVPFGEAASWLVPAAVADRLRLDNGYSAGRGDAPLLDAHGTPLGTLICWEGIYADATRALVRDGARLLVNVSNDDWFGGHAAVAQHFRATLLRAVETHRPLLRVTNSGVTAVVDARGVVVATAPAATATVLPARVTLDQGLTPYVRFGDVFAWACVGVAALGALRFARG